MEHVAILGASRGLGAALARHITHEGHRVLGLARKMDRLEQLKNELNYFSYRTADFSTQAGQETALSVLAQNDFTRIFVVAAGGPHGLYSEREWSSHRWAFEVSLLFPARVLHFVAGLPKPVPVVLVGSSVAESQPDPGATSYSSAKHALWAIQRSLRVEYPDWDLKLFSPGYMNTDMLPKGAGVRQAGVHDPVRVAEELWHWSLTGPMGGHKVQPLHPAEVG